METKYVECRSCVTLKPFLGAEVDRLEPVARMKGTRGELFIYIHAHPNVYDGFPRS